MGVPVSASSNNGPLFNGQEFSDLRRYLGFQHDLKTLLDPQANGEAEQFMRVLKKLYQVTVLIGANLEQEDCTGS